VNQRYIISDKYRTLSFVQSTSIQRLANLNPLFLNQQDNDVLFVNFISNWMRNADQLGFSAGLNYSRNASELNDFRLFGPILGMNKNFFSNDLQTSLNINYNRARLNGNPNGSVLNLFSNLNYKISDQHSFQLMINLLSNTSAVQTSNFTELRFMGGYIFTFQKKRHEKT
jgi:hypothetical protein